MRAAGILVVWLIVAIAVSASGNLYDPPRVILPIIIWSPVVVFLIIVISFRRFRLWILSLDLKWLIGVHVVRAPIGVALLLMDSAGRLPAEFAIKAGVGDIVIGLTAVFVMFLGTLSAVRIRTTFVWNVLGLADILMVIAIAQRLLFFGDDPRALVELTRFPIFVVPMFVVPLVVITHLIIFGQLLRTRMGHAS